jgi:hypothetical protein
VQVKISYQDEDAAAPACSWRWLAEYGFVPDMVANDTVHDTAARRRQCYGFQLTAKEVVSACCPEAAPDAASQPAVGLWVELDGSGSLPPGLLSWVDGVITQQRSALHGCTCSDGPGALGAVLAERRAALKSAIQEPPDDAYDAHCPAAALRAVAADGVAALSATLRAAGGDGATADV